MKKLMALALVIGITTSFAVAADSGIKTTKDILKKNYNTTKQDLKSQKKATQDDYKNKKESLTTAKKAEYTKKKNTEVAEIDAQIKAKKKELAELKKSKSDSLTSSTKTKVLEKQLNSLESKKQKTVKYYNDILSE